MPELPEVEVTAQRLRASLAGATLAECRSGAKRLRHPFPKAAATRLAGQPLIRIGRRAKYLLLEFPPGWLAVHLGMSGAIRLCGPDEPEILHDHVRMRFACPEKIMVDLVYHDPRRFGSFRWIDRRYADSLDQQLSNSPLGVEPLGTVFNGAYLHKASRGKKVSVKQWLLSGHAVVGVGNIYASEVMFISGIDPRRKAGSLSLAHCELLADAIVKVLRQAIDAGGTTLQDFTAPDGSEGRYGQSHQVYGREGLACPRCGKSIVRIVQQQRSTFCCRGCQR